MLKLSTLGPLDLVDEDGRRLETLLAHPKCFALLSYLAVAYPGAFCRRDALVALFWPELDERHARSALRQLLYSLRQACGQGVAVNKGDHSIGIAESRVWCDLVAFRRLLEQKDHEGALALYRGSFLEGFHLPGAPEFERWLDQERAVSRRAAAAATWARVECALALGDGRAARRRARRAVALEPYSEPGWCRLIRLLQKQGDRAGAVLAYRKLTEVLDSELGLSPSPKTRAVAASLLTQEEPTRRDVSDPVRPAGPPDPLAAPRTSPQSGGSPARTLSLRSAVARTPVASDSPERRAALPPKPIHSLGRHRSRRLWGFVFLAASAVVLVVALPVRRSPVAPNPRLSGVIVRPVETLSRAPEDIEFAQTLTHELEARLHSVPGLQIVSEDLGGPPDGVATLQQRARELDVRLILMCDYHREGSRVRIHTRLLDVSTGRLHPMVTFARPVEDLTTIHVEVADGVGVAVARFLEELNMISPIDLAHP